ncbi:SulP family inorganic anion transporter [Pseudactinotalea sp. Z1748]|uniref:SulP family inorganic anion transporter n=1 Tax=Pseudactinotalea sp. Z1748 TaxID=3413027 RepID=UPI003C7A4889
MPETTADEPGPRSRLRSLASDALAGLTTAVVSVPSGMATAALAGVNPVYGLYATVVSPTVGGLFASSQLMQIATTGASALTAGQAIAAYPEEQRGPALFLLVGLAGLFLIGFGVVGAGRLVRYISYPVMTAFLSGVAAALLMDQAAQFAGYSSDWSITLGAFVDLLVSLHEVSWTTVAVGAIALALMVALARTPLANGASLVALVVPTVVAFWWRPEGVELVRDVSDIPTGLPPFALPDLTLLTPGLVASAFALAVVVAVQGAGVSQAARNPDGSQPNTSRDMFAQGLGNTAASFFHGMPTGASVGQSALNRQVGARSRFAMVFHGLGMLVILLVASQLVGLVPMTVLAAILMVAAFQAIEFGAMASIWRVGGSGRWAMAVTFLATLLTSVPMAVAIGVVLTLVLFILRAGETVQVHGLRIDDDDRIHVVDPPEELSSHGVSVIDVDGSLYFAAARTLRERLPPASSGEGAAVVLRVRGNTQIGSTFIEEINDYAQQLARNGGRLYLCGLTTRFTQQIVRSERVALDDQVVLVPGEEILGASLRAAIRLAEEWVRAQGH